MHLHQSRYDRSFEFLKINIITEQQLKANLFYLEEDSLCLGESSQRSVSPTCSKTDIHSVHFFWFS